MLCALLAFPAAALAQQCYIEQAYQCGPGSLCAEDGTCKPIATVIPGTIYWVDQATGNDTNDGSQLRPWKTITRAAQGNELTPGDGVLVRAGTYYEEIVPKRGGTPGLPITYAANPGEDVIVSGAEPLPGVWTKSGNVWSMKWPYDSWLVGDLNKLVYNRNGVMKYDAARHAEMVIAAGEVLKPYYNNIDTWQPAYTPTSLPEGTFFVKGTGSLTSIGKPETVYVRLPGDANPNQVRMETSRKGHLFNPSGNVECSAKVPGSGLPPHSHLRLAGFTFRHLANILKQGAVCTGNEGTLIDNIVIEWTNGTGILLFGSHQRVRGVRAYYNGIDGFKGGVNESQGCDDCTVAHSVAKYNNWKGYDPYHESGGGKWTYTTNSLFTQLDFSENEGPGLWLDTDNTNNIIERSRFHSNMGVNLFIEVNSDGNLVRNNVSTMARTAQPAPGDTWYVKWNGIVGNRFIGHGMVVDVSEGNMVVHNTFMGNLASGLRIGSDERGDATNTGFYNNLFLDNVRGQASAELAYEKYVDVTPALTNHGGGNAYWPHNSTAFSTFHFQPKGGASIPGFETNALPAWRTWSKTDLSSTMVDKSAPHVTDLNDPFAGWMLADGSQFSGKAAALPAGVPKVTNDFFGNPRPLSGAALGAHEGATPFIDVAYRAGHNLVGLPLDVADADVDAVFPDATGGTLLTFNGVSFVPPIPATLVPGAGYWLRFPANGTQRVAGIPAASRTWSLHTGWNIVSGPTCAVTLAQVNDPAGIIDPDLFFGYENTFVVPENQLLEPGKGYWVFAKKTGSVTLTCGSASKASPAVAARAPEGPRVVVQTGAGLAQTLSWRPDAASSAAMPPAPAGTGLDVRFMDGRLASARIDGATLLLQAGAPASATFLDLDGGAYALDVFDSAGARIATLPIVSGAATPIPGAGARRLVVRAADAGATPVSFALEQNYPNPFRDRTAIRYALPEAGPVTLRVVDVLGREVLRVIDADQPAGWHSATLDATQLPSGVYLYEMEAGAYRAVRQFLVVR
ncbi:MAG: right-handed parallel beta-helix repeat-containing protein [Rhodothermales bacterium]